MKTSKKYTTLRKITILDMREMQLKLIKMGHCCPWLAKVQRTAAGGVPLRTGEEHMMRTLRSSA